MGSVVSHPFGESLQRGTPNWSSVPIELSNSIPPRVCDWHGHPRLRAWVLSLWLALALFALAIALVEMSWFASGVGNWQWLAATLAAALFFSLLWFFGCIYVNDAPATEDEWREHLAWMAEWSSRRKRRRR